MQVNTFYKWGIAILSTVMAAGCVSFGTPVATAPPADTRPVSEIVLANPSLTGSLMYVYDYKADKYTAPAPKGYKPFYVSTFGRHWARYAVKVQYEMIKTVLDYASQAGLLTERGKQLREDYNAFYKDAIYREGELTDIGREQLRTIAGRLFERFPEVFEGDTKIAAISSPVPRVIMSMVSFIDELQERDKTLTVDENGSDSYSPLVRPNWGPLDFERPQSIEEIAAPYIPYFRSTVDISGILGRIFTKPEKVLAGTKTDDVVLVRYMFEVSNGFGCIPGQDSPFEDLFTPEDRFAIFRASWSRVMRFLGRYDGAESLYPDFLAYTLKDIIEKADADIAGGDVQLRLRFSHDSSVMPLAVLMNLDGKGRTATSPDEALEIFHPWDMPMGGGFQFIFYRKGKNDDILVKVLWNEEDAALPLGDGPYYKWEDFKAFYTPIINNTLSMLDVLRGESRARQKAIN